MAVEETQSPANIHPVKLGEPLKQIKFAIDGAGAETITFDQPFAATPKLISLTSVGASTVSVACTGISTTAIAVEAIGGAVDNALAIIQGKVGV